MAEADPGQLDVGIVGPADPVAQRQDPGDVTVGIVTRAGDEPGIAFGQIRGQIAVEGGPDPKFQLGGQRPETLDKHLGVNGTKIPHQIGVQPVTIENTQSHLLLLDRSAPADRRPAGARD